MDWTKEYFDDLYLKYFLLDQDKERTRKQAEFIQKFFEANDYLLDAGCGIGRHAIELGKLGFNVLGIDFNENYIKLAKENALKENVSNVDFISMDLRELNFNDKFDGILSLWSSFGYFDDDTNDLILKRFFVALKKNGKLIIDVENKDYILKFFIKETFKEKEDHVFILERRKYNPITSVVSTHRFIIGPNFRKDYLRYIRIYSLSELIYILKNSGFSQFQYFGNYEGKPFNVDSERIILIAEKKS